MPISPEEAESVYKNADVIYTAADIEQAADRMAQEITAELKDKNPLVLSVMIGGLVPTGLLLSRMDFPMNIDYIHASRYRGNTSGGELGWIARPASSLEGRTILIVDDILDEGKTLAAIIEDCKQLGAVEVYTAVLVEKKHDRKEAIMADFTGVEVEDRYVFGSGMDYKGYLRNVSGIYAVNDDA